MSSTCMENRIKNTEPLGLPLETPANTSRKPLARYADRNRLKSAPSHEFTPWQSPWERRKGVLVSSRNKGRFLAPPGLLDLDERLRLVILNIRQSTHGCTPQYFQVVCGCGFRALVRGCMKYDCPQCGNHIGRRRAKRAKERLDKGRGNRQILYTVFTIPPELRLKFKDKKEWRKACRLAWSILRDGFAGEFGVESTHPHGDPLDPDNTLAAEGDGGIFHPHMNFLWVRAEGKRGYFTPVELRWLKKLWIEGLAKLTGARPPVVNVWHHYYKTKVELSERIRYVMRTFPGFSEWVGSIRWYGKYPRSKKEDKSDGTCPHCHQTPLWICSMTRTEYLEFRRDHEELDEDLPPPDILRR